MDKTITVHVRVSREAHKKAKLLAVKREMTIGEIYADAVSLL